MLCFVGAVELEILVYLRRDKYISIRVLDLELITGEAYAIILIVNLEPILSRLYRGHSNQFDLQVKSGLY